VLPIMAQYLSLGDEEAALAYDNAMRHFTADRRRSPQLPEHLVRDQAEAVKPERVPRAAELCDLRFIGDH
jgi:hypothetical protein